MVFIQYSLEQRAEAVTIQILDLTGRMVEQIESMKNVPGNHTVSHDISSLPGGLYLLNIHTGDGSVTKKLMIGQ